MRNICIISALAIFLLNGCNKDGDLNGLVSKESVSGFVQKGPFISGTSITINELDNDLSQTGKNFNTQIKDNKGSFVFGNVSLVSNYVSLKADGFYFNEVLGEQSVSQITLYALSDISDKNSINVNILSHLEKPRIENLVAGGTGFKEAKIQAQSEILAIFNIEKTGMQSSEELDISKQGDDNAILLATSVILQGFRSEGELTEILSNIGTDLSEDGILSSASLGSQLINQAVPLDTVAIRTNLENRYTELGAEAAIPNFEKYLKNFIDNTNFVITGILIEYPDTGIHGKNILATDKTQYNGANFSLAANLARGTKLKIKITALNPGDSLIGVWYYQLGTELNWRISDFNMDNKTQEFTAIDSGKACDLKMEFEPGGFLVEYFEMGATVSTRTKTIEVTSDK